MFFSRNMKHKLYYLNIYSLCVVLQCACFLCDSMSSCLFCRKRSRLWASATIATLCLIIPPLWSRMNCGWWWSCSVEASHLPLNRIDVALVFTFTVTHVSSSNIFTFNSSPNFDWMLACRHFSWKPFNIYLVEGYNVFVCINVFLLSVICGM